MTVARLEDEMGTGELDRWRRYEMVEPFLGDRIELLGGLICSVIANVNRGKTTAPYEASDFMPYFSRDRQQAALAERTGVVPQNDDDAQVMRLVLAFGGKIRG